MTHNMTQGSPARLLLRFALPILVGSVLQHCYVLIDSIIVGQHLGVNALAAIGAVSNLDGLLLGFIMAMMQGFAILVAQRFGAQDSDGLRKAVTMSIALTLAAIAILIAISLPLAQTMLRWLGTPAEIMDDAHTYITIIFACMAVPMVSNLAYAILRAMGDSRTPLYCLIIGSIVNILLDLLFILYFKMGVAGAALGSILAQLFPWPYLIHRLRRMKEIHPRRADWRPDGRTIGQLLKLGLPMAIQNSIALVGVILLQVTVNGFGVAHIAAFTASMRIFFFMKQPSEAFGYAISAYVGQNFGAGNMARVREGVRRALQITLGVCGVAMLCVFLWGRGIIGLVIPATEAEAIAIAHPLLLTLTVMLPVLYAMYAFRPALQGMGNTLIPMLSGGVEMVARTVLALTLPAAIGFFGVGIAETSAWLGAAVVTGIAYFSMLRQ